MEMYEAIYKRRTVREFLDKEDVCLCHAGKYCYASVEENFKNNRKVILDDIREKPPQLIPRYEGIC